MEIEEKADLLAKGLLDGSISCDECQDLHDLVERVRAGQMDFEKFKGIIKEQLLTQTI